MAAVFVAGCGDDTKKKKPATPKPPVVKCSIDLTANEKSSAFNKSKATCKPGTARLTVIVPSGAKGEHGVGIDGGIYKDVVGAPVKPGRRTSLTVDLKAGKYKIFDSYKKNRNKGYEVDLTVNK